MTDNTDNEETPPAPSNMAPTERRLLQLTVELLGLIAETNRAVAYLVNNNKQETFNQLTQNAAKFKEVLALAKELLNEL